MEKKLTKNELIDILQSDEYLKYSGDALCQWLLDLKYAYVEPYENEELDELFQRYWNPSDIADYLVSKLTSSVIEPLDALAEVRGVLYYKEGETYWSYFDTEEETNFWDVNDEDLHQLRLRMLEVLTREDKE